ncbi:MAG: nitroreductase family protein [Acetobacter malorum]
MTVFAKREARPAVAQFILNRWSARAFTPVDITQDALFDLLEAGRWAPSAYNSQPWRFIYARRNTPDWERFLGLLIPFNRSWAENASAIVYIASSTTIPDSKTGEPVPAPSHAFDAGAASVLIQLQASQNGWNAHPVSGFESELARASLEIPEDYALHAALVIGRRGDGDSLLPESLRAREHPSGRNPLSAYAFEGRYQTR